jgi:predicted nucleotidyltransferase
MMTREEVLATLRKHKPELQKKYPLASVELFGSYARNEQTPDSDIDILVEFSEPVGYEFIDLLIEFETIFAGYKVDLLSKNGIKPHYRPYIEEDIIHV